MPLGKLGREGESLANVRFLEIREIGQKLLYRPTRGHRLDNHPDGHAYTANTLFSAHDRRIDRDPPQRLHT